MNTILIGLILVSVCVAKSTAQSDGKSIDELLKDVFTPGPTMATGSEGTTVPSPESNNRDNVDPTLNGGDTGGIPGTGECTCVPYYLCNNGSINTNGEGVIDIRINDGPCTSYLEVCCNKDDQRIDPITPTPDPLPTPAGCGRRHPEGVGFRITGDKENEAQFGEFPWMVAILREESVEGNPQKLNVYQCGGALIHPQVVVTAAHCVSAWKTKTYKVRAGEWDTQHMQELYPHQDRQVQSVMIHPQFYAGALYNDIAILFLDSPVELAENVAVVCLPPLNQVPQGRCFATGWGKDIFGKKGKYQVILKKIDLPIVPNPDCQSSLRKTRLGKFFELHRSFICAGGEPGKDTCKGDGGSPLVCPIPGQKDRYYQAGIVAWGIGCGENQTPGVYANVALFRDWIDEQMRFNNLDLSTYQA